MSDVALGRIRSYRGRPLAERRLLREATVVVALVRAGLTFLPYPMLKRMAQPVRSLVARTSSVDGTPQELARAVRVAARHIRRASCLTQALALDLMLRRRGIVAVLVIGVAPGEGRIHAHAWLELDGAVLIGGDVADYARLRRAAEQRA